MPEEKKQNIIKPLDLVIHDWAVLTPEERKLALCDIQHMADYLAKQPSGSPLAFPVSSVTSFRRSRSINLVASLLTFLTEETNGERIPEHEMRNGQYAEKKT